VPFAALPIHGLLVFTGPAGVGKSSIARGLGNQIARVRKNAVRGATLGEVNSHTLTSDLLGRSQKAVKEIEGVTKINNKIEVLPLSPLDAQIRRAEYHAIYGEPQLQRYAMGTMPSIHIIVKNGHVTLLGYVDNEGDKNVAEIRAKSVPNVFSVMDNLQVRPGRPSTSQY